MMQKPKPTQIPATRPDFLQDRELLQQAKERRDRIVAVYSKIYGIAKFVFIILMAYGVELEDTPSGIKSHIEQVEVQMAHDSTTLLLQTIEDLFYALYARLNIEIANVQLSESFQLDTHGKAALLRQSSYIAASAAGQHLPFPGHISMIFQACKRILASEDICGVLDKELIRMHQTAYVQRAVEAYVANNKDRGHCHPDDVLGYRRHVEMVTLGPNSPFARQWTGLNPIYKHAPGWVLATLSEEFLGSQKPAADKNSKTTNGNCECVGVALKKRTQTLTPLQTTMAMAMAIKRPNSITSSSTTSSSSCATLSTHPLLPQHRRTEANREAAYAMLNGISVGEHRRIEGKRALRQYVRDQLCICFGHCSCARRCTLKSTRACPCSARMSVICNVDIGQHDQQWLDEEGQEQQQQPVMDPRENFRKRCAQLACALFVGLCTVKKGTVMSFFEVYMEVKAGSEVFHQEVLAYREVMGKR